MHFYALFFCDGNRLFIIGHKFGKINAGEFFNSLYHRHSRKRGFQIDIRAAVRDMQCAAGVLRRLADQRLRDIHHTVVIRIRLIEFYTGKFGIVANIHTLVSEVSADLIHSFHAAHDQPFQIKFRCDAQVHIQIQRIVMRDKRPCRRAAGDRIEHRGFHLNESVAVQIIPDGSDDLGAFDEGILNAGIHDHIQIAFSVSCIRIG